MPKRTSVGGAGASARLARAGVDPGDLRDVGEVDPVDHVAERDAVDRLHPLVLAVKILVGLGQADGGVASLVEWDVVAPSAVAVAAEDEGHLEVGQVELAGFLDVAGELPRGSVVLAADRPPSRAWASVSLAGPPRRRRGPGGCR